jgi:hypothetical protein
VSFAFGERILKVSIAETAESAPRLGTVDSGRRKRRVLQANSVEDNGQL